jgi:hypothetical protein
MAAKMTRRVAKFLLALLVLPALWAAPVQAQEITASATPGTGRGSAGAPLAEWVELAGQSTHWYKFKYEYDDNDDSDDDNEPSQVVVELRTQTAGCPKFEVWSTRDLDFPRYEDDDDDNGKPQPTGRGTPLVIDTETDDDGNETTVTMPNLLTWAGGSKASETHYVLVKNTSQQACAYQLKISGPDVHL